jgi:hypothetical protein
MKNMKGQTAVRQSSLYSAPLFIALFSILLPGRLVALDLDPVRVGGYDTSGSALGVAVSGTLSDNLAYHADYPWAGGDGGGIYNDGGTVTVSNSTLSGNTADVNFGRGGGLYNNGTVTVENASSITGNTASDLGADVYNLSLLYRDGTSAIGILNGNPAISF